MDAVIIKLKNPILRGEYLKKNGMEYITESLFKVIDKRLFFLAVIKYGIEYTECKGYEDTSH